MSGCSGSACPPSGPPSCVHYNKNLATTADRYIRIEPTIAWAITDPGPGYKPLCAGEDTTCGNPAVCKPLCDRMDVLKLADAAIHLLIHMYISGFSSGC